MGLLASIPVESPAAQSWSDRLLDDLRRGETLACFAIEDLPMAHKQAPDHVRYAGHLPLLPSRNILVQTPPAPVLLEYFAQLGFGQKNIYRLPALNDPSAFAALRAAFAQSCVPHRIACQSRSRLSVQLERYLNVSDAYFVSGIESVQDSFNKLNVQRLCAEQGIPHISAQRVRHASDVLAEFSEKNVFDGGCILRRAVGAGGHFILHMRSADQPIPHADLFFMQPCLLLPFIPRQQYFYDLKVEGVLQAGRIEILSCLGMENPQSRFFGGTSVDALAPELRHAIETTLRKVGKLLHQSGVVSGPVSIDGFLMPGGTAPVFRVYDINSCCGQSFAPWLSVRAIARELRKTLSWELRLFGLYGALNADSLMRALQPLLFRWERGEGIIPLCITGGSSMRIGKLACMCLLLAPTPMRRFELKQNLLKQLHSLAKFTIMPF